MKEQHVKICLHVPSAISRVLWLELIQTLKPAKTLALDTTLIFDEHGLKVICHSLEDEPATIRGQHQ